MEPRLIRIDAFTVAGIQTRTCNGNEVIPDTARIPALWGQFFADYLPSVIGSQASGVPEIIGVYSEYESDVDGDYTLVAGIRSEGERGSEKSTVSVQAGTYLVFDVEGAFPQAVMQGWMDIWSYFSAPGCAYRRAYTSDFEQYLGMSHAAIHVSVLDGLDI